MAERQIEHRKSYLALSARFPVVNWRSRHVAKSAYFSVSDERGSLIKDYLYYLVPYLIYRILM